MKYRLNGEEVAIDIDGEAVLGPDLCLLEKDDNLVADCAWQDQGYVVSPMLDASTFTVLYEGICALILKALDFAGRRVNANEFDLRHYHEYCPDQGTHLKVVEFLRSNAGLENLPISHRILDDKVSKLCGKSVSCNVAGQAASGYFFIRLVRPRPHKDNNPPHKDVWLDRLRNAINLYLPLTGSDDDTSLALAPGSHYWLESRVARTAPGAFVNGMQFTVPSVVMDDLTLEMIRPRVVETEGMVFSPYLIHGGAINLSRKNTRVSLEVRFWRVREGDLR